MIEPSCLGVLLFLVFLCFNKTFWEFHVFHAAWLDHDYSMGQSEATWLEADHVGSHMLVIRIKSHSITPLLLIYQLVLLLFSADPIRSRCESLETDHSRR